jgi:hypothetical protein
MKGRAGKLEKTQGNADDVENNGVTKSAIRKSMQAKSADGGQFRGATRKMMKTKERDFGPPSPTDCGLERTESGAEVCGTAGRKGVRRLAGYLMGYYTIWLAPVKRKVVPFWELADRDASR